jgi:ABC-type phosphate transport system substrate-binding protein
MTLRIAQWIVVASCMLSAAAARAEGIKVIVNPGVPGNSIKRDVLAGIFLKKLTRWGDGQPISVVEQSMGARVRASFCQEVLRETPQAVQAYWTQQMFASRLVHPPVKPSDQDVVAFVASTKGAIGYVSAEADVGGAVKTLRVAE